MRVIFVLPSAGGGGGAHSIVQEVLVCAGLAWQQRLPTPRSLASEFQVRYPELQRNAVDNPSFGTIEELASISRNTIWPSPRQRFRSVRWFKQRKRGVSRIKLGYYIQDYEPLFYPPGSREWNEARDSFGLMQNALLFAKTDWLCSMVEANHNIHVSRVKASIDHDIYHPVDRRLGAIANHRHGPTKDCPSRAQTNHSCLGAHCLRIRYTRRNHVFRL